MPRSAACRAGLVRLALAAAAFAVPALLPSPAHGEIIHPRDLVHGVRISPAQCAAYPYAVWVNVANRGFCIRYYVSTAGGEGDVPIVWLSGDKLGTVNMRTKRINLGKDERDIDTAGLQRQANRLSKLAGTTAIYLARPGLDGSSGYHGYRRSWLELYVVSAAMDAIRRRHGFRGFHVAGQSGGAGLIGGLMGIRRDLVCVVPGSGRLALLKAPQRERDRYLEFFDASRAVRLIAANRTMRILVVTDPRDQTVRAQHQVAFVRMLLAAGGRVEQFYVDATDKKHHGVAAYTRFVVAACVRGMNHQQILAGIADVQREARGGGKKGRHHAGREERRQERQERRERRREARTGQGVPPSAPAQPAYRQPRPYAGAPQQPYQPPQPSYAEEPEPYQPPQPYAGAPRPYRPAQPSYQQPRPLPRTGSRRPQFNRPAPAPRQTRYAQQPQQPAQPVQQPAYRQPRPAAGGRPQFTRPVPPRDSPYYQPQQPRAD